MDIKSNLENLINEVLANIFTDLGGQTYPSLKKITLEHPGDIKNGDYSSNVAMVFFADVKKDLNIKGSNLHYNLTSNSGDYKWQSPRDFAVVIKNKILEKKVNYISNIEVAGPGFINFHLSRSFFTDSIKHVVGNMEWGRNDLLQNKKVMVEYTQPNPFKPFHIGHLMSNAIGESISRIVEFSGAQTIRANYQGDVGPHVAKAIYILQKEGIPEEGTISEKAQHIGMCYAKGNDAYENDPAAKAEIDAINKKVYDKSDEKINAIYEWGREVTLNAFEEIYTLLGTKFDYYFFESEMAPIGTKIVKEHLGSVFDESDGALVFHGEKHDPKLHTRVFINSQGLPTYETKEIGLTATKFKKENPDLSIVTTAIEQAEYMKVVAKAISLMHPEYEQRMKHITHGMMRLTTGKMSSRKGNVITGESLLRESMDVIREKVSERELSEAEKATIAEEVGVAALKYSILKSSLGSDIIYDFEKSISFDGDSGPYLQYTAVRAHAILEKTKSLGLFVGYQEIPEEISSLERLLYRFPNIVSRSYTELEPHHIATYLTELASAFNTFYGNTFIANKEDPHAPYRVAIVEAFYQTMKNGLWLLGIKTPEKM